MDDGGGWKPSTWISSRDRRQGEKSVVVPSSRPEDYMDEEDGLLGMFPTRKEGYGVLGAVGTRSREIEQIFGSNAEHNASVGNTGFALPRELLEVPATEDSIGHKLLQTMGWRVGTGIGARISRRRKSSIGGGTTGTDGEDSDDENNESIASLSRVANSGLGALSANAIIDGQVTFAPRDEAARLQIPPVKTDMYGIGYDPMKEQNSLRGLGIGSSSMTGALTLFGGGEDSRGTYEMGTAIVEAGSHNQRFHSWHNQRKQQQQEEQQSALVPHHHHVKQRAASGFAVDDGDDDVYDSIEATSRANFFGIEMSEDRNDSIEGRDFGGNIKDDDRTNLVSHPLMDVFRTDKSDVESRKGFDGRLALPGFHYASSEASRGDDDRYTSGSEALIRRKWTLASPPRGWRAVHIFDKPLEESSKPKTSMPHPVPLFTQLKDQQQFSDATPDSIYNGDGDTATSNLPPRPLLPGTGNFRQMAALMSSRFTKASSTLTSSGEETAVVPSFPIKTTGNCAAEYSVSPSAAPPNATLASRRVVLPWQPEKLLCKRFNVPVPSAELVQLRTSALSKNTLPTSFGSSRISSVDTQASQQMQPYRTEDLTKQSQRTRLGDSVVDTRGKGSGLGSSYPMKSSDSNKMDSTKISVIPPENTELVLDALENLPPVELFKAVFEPSSEEDDDSDSDDSDSDGDAIDNDENGQDKEPIGNDGRRPIRPQPKFQPQPQPLRQSVLEPAIPEAVQRGSDAKVSTGPPQRVEFVPRSSRTQGTTLATSRKIHQRKRQLATAENELLETESNTGSTSASVSDFGSDEEHFSESDSSDMEVRSKKKKLGKRNLSKKKKKKRTKKKESKKHKKKKKRREESATP